MICEVEKAHQSDINCVAWSPQTGSNILVSCGDDNLIKIWQFIP